MEENRKGKIFFPDVVIDQLIVILIVIFVFVALATFYPSSIEENADPFNPPNIIKPVWYFLANHNIIKIGDYLLGKSLRSVAILFQIIVFIFFLFLPWIDKSKERHLKKRLGIIIIGTFMILGYIILTLCG
jgi:quinol-cytochrome oxidoreductase complex cytochrome b subunit